MSATSAYPNGVRATTPTARPLSGAHQKMLLEESGIAPEIVEERGYYTISERQNFPCGFGKNKRRVPALAIPIYSPDRETSFVRVRHSKPRPTYKKKNGKWKQTGATRYDQPAGQGIILDVHPRNAERVKDPSIPLWVTEGEKKGDCLTSHGLCVVTLTGVDCWGKGGELLPDWDHVALFDRVIYVVFDSDVMVKPEVQNALRRLVGALKARGAQVQAVYLPDDEEGSKQGVDDYLVAGGKVENLYSLARPYEASDLPKMRLSKDDRLRACVEEAWKIHDSLPTRKDSECIHRAVWRAFISTAMNRGKPTTEGVRFYLSSNDGALQAATSQPTFSRHAQAFENVGLLRIERPSDPGEANVYTLLTGTIPFGNNSERSGDQGEEKRSQEKEAGNFFFGVSSHRYSQTECVQKDVPELRHSRVILSWRQDDLGRRVCEVDPLLRLSAKRREIIVHLIAYGGEASIPELHRRFAPSERTDPAKFKFVVLRPMYKDFPIIEVKDGRVRLREDWRKGLEKARIHGEEQDAHDQQVVRYELKRIAFCDPDRDKHDHAPTQAEMGEKRRERAMLTPEEELDADAIFAFEERYGPGSFEYNRASAKKLFYKFGRWPDAESLKRLQNHPEYTYNTGRSVYSSRWPGS